MLGRYPVATRRLATLDAADTIAIAGPLELFNADKNAEWIFLLETSPGDAGNPAGDMLRLSDYGFDTDNTETPPDTGYPNRLEVPLNFETRIPFPDSLEAVGGIGFGVVEIRNEDGALSYLLQKSWEGRQVDIKYGGILNPGRAGEQRLKLVDYGLALRGTVDGVESDGGRLILRLRDGLGKNLEADLQQNRYDSPAELAGVPIPLTFGKVENRKCILENAALLRYRVHERAVEGIDEVRIRGTPIGIDDGNVATQAELNLATILSGHYLTCHAVGKFRIGNTPDGEVTADVRGDNIGGYVDTTAGIAMRVGTWKLGLVEADDFEGASFATFTPAVTTGFAFDDEISGIDALGLIVSRSHGWVRVTSQARIAIGRYVAPESRVPAAELTDDSVSAEADSTGVPPAWRIKVGYRSMGLVQGADSLAALLSAELRQLYSTPFRYVIAEDATIKDVHFDAREVEFLTHFANSADAQSFANELLALFRVRRREYRVRQERGILKRVPGDVIKILSADSDLSTGRHALIVSVAEIGHELASEFGAWG